MGEPLNDRTDDLDENDDVDQCHHGVPYADDCWDCEDEEDDDFEDDDFDDDDDDPDDDPATADHGVACWYSPAQRWIVTAASGVRYERCPCGHAEALPPEGASL